jgi:ferritin-like metal-binding protein YciE
MTLNTLHDLFVEELQDLYDAEQQILEVMPSMIKATQSEELKQAFETHTEETQAQIAKLETLCEKLNIAVEGKHCVGMEGIIEEGVETVGENTTSSVLDAALIGVAQRVEHYEIAAYGCAAAYAKELGFTDAAATLAGIMEEEKRTDQKLSKLAEDHINPAVTNRLVQ